MTKKLLLMIAVGFSCLSSYAQSISPVETLEFCPLQDITFTVTLPLIQNNTLPSVASWTNTPIVVSGISSVINTPTQTTCTFVGRFKDVNINQVFKIDYTPKGSSPTFYLFSFKKIKSLFYPNPIGNTSGSPCQMFTASQTSITAQRCQISNFPISVTPTNWSTYGEGNDFCWGSISTYEYLLPNGWSIGTTTSNGSNWISGTASVTVTSDLSNGVNGQIRIRPTNNCGSGFANNATQAIIAINRPAPTLFITGGTDNLCSNPANYTITGMPTGSTVSWAIQGNTASANITAGQNTPTVTVTPTSIIGNITLVATVNHCTFTYTSLKNIRVGIYSASDYNITQYPSTVCLNQTVQFGFPWYYFPPASGTTYTWMWGGGLVYVSGQGTNVITFRAPSSPPSGTPWVIGRANNACGSGPMSQTKYLAFQTGCWSQFNVSPNPTSDIIRVDINPNNIYSSKILAEIQRVELFDKMGVIKYSRNFGKGLQSANISIGNLPNDIYTLRIFDGETWHSHKVIIQH